MALSDYGIEEIERAPLYVPNLMSFENENTFLGSYEGLRFKLTPDVGESLITAECWRGPLCYEKSEMEVVSRFPLTKEGIEEMTGWILEKSGKQPE